MKKTFVSFFSFLSSHSCFPISLPHTPSLLFTSSSSFYRLHLLLYQSLFHYIFLNILFSLSPLLFSSHTTIPYMLPSLLYPFTYSAFSLIILLPIFVYFIFHYPSSYSYPPRSILFSFQIF